LPVADRRKQAYGHYLACPECGGKDTTVASHDTRQKTVVRRHKCKACQHVYKTAMTYYANDKEPMAGRAD
jgi:rubredoxin